MVFLTWIWLFTKFWFGMIAVNACKYQHINNPCQTYLIVIVFFDEIKLYQHLSENSSLHITTMILVSFASGIPQIEILFVFMNIGYTHQILALNIANIQWISYWSFCLISFAWMWPQNHRYSTLGIVCVL